MPVRSAVDRRTESFLTSAGYLTRPMVNAIRLVDDANDVFSDTRCGLLPKITSAMAPTPAPADVATSIRTVVTNEVNGGLVPEGPRRDYVLKLLDAHAAPADVDLAKQAYVADLQTRFQASTDQLSSPAGVAALKERVLSRKRLAFAMTPQQLPEDVANEGSQ
jgi:hypothetical protein